MNETRVPDVPTGPERAPAWVTGLSELIDRLHLVIRINAMWWMLSLLGLVVVGVGPASCAAAEAFIAARHGERVRVLPLMWATYQDAFWPANLRMLPLLVVQAGSLSMLWMTDRKSTRLNSSHVAISYAVFCLKKKKTTIVVS